jgi:hypothetical protein
MAGKAGRTASTPEVAFDAACTLVESALSGATRREIVEAASSGPRLAQGLRRLRESLASHVLKTAGEQIGLARFIKAYDARTRADGFHVLHDWDGKADRVNENIIPVDVLDYTIDKRGDDPADRRVLAILLDYYLMHVLSLLSLRIWDEGDADENLARLNRLLQDLQGPNGSGQQFVRDAETLLLVATSHFELEERGYHTLLDKVRTLDPVHQTNMALGHAASMGSHLRFGFDVTYRRDTVVMRDDNVADYPWLCFALVTLMRAYLRLQGNPTDARRAAIVEAMLHGLSPDARAFVGSRPPASLSACEAERAEFAESFRQVKRDLLASFERYRPSADRYSPISFLFNFSHNVLKGIVVDALMWGEPWTLTLNDLFTTETRDGADDQSKQALVQTLMAYARSSPDRIAGRLMPVIIYDADLGRRAFSTTMQKLRE